MNVPDGHKTEETGWFRRPANLALLGFLGVAAFFLLTEHRAHSFGILLFLLLLACPLLHLFMHRGRGEHHNEEDKP